MTDLKELIRKQRQMTEGLVAEAQAYYEQTGPVEVEAVFGETLATFQVPFVHPREFNDLASIHGPRPSVAQDTTLWFDLDAVTRNYPGVVVVVDGDEDDMYRVRNKQAVYIWPELYEQMAPEDRNNFRMAVWSLNVYEPKLRREAWQKRNSEHQEEVKNLPLRDLIDVVTAEGEEADRG